MNDNTDTPSTDDIPIDINDVIARLADRQAHFSDHIDC